MSTTVHIQIDSIAQILKKRNLEEKGTAMKFFAAEFAKKMDPYVPYMAHGGVHLKSNIDIKPGEITYKMPYARRNFYGNRGMGEEGTGRGGRRGSRWDERAWLNHKTELTTAVAKYVGGEEG
jgi:hypothetical protein